MKRFYGHKLPTTLCVAALAGLVTSAQAEPAAKGADPNTALVRVGVKSNQTPVKLCGNIRQDANGTLTVPGGGIMPGREPWGWVAVGPEGKPMPQLEGLRSLTICGWTRPTRRPAGPVGNQLVFNLNHSREGFDLVQLRDGRFRLGINEWPDKVDNDSSPRPIKAGQWIFFAVTYDGTKQSDNVRWYIGDPTTPATLDRATSYAAGPTAASSGPLTIAHCNHTILHHPTKHQLQGQLHGIRIFGSRTGPDGVLGLESIRALQTASDAVPDFKNPAPGAPMPAVSSGPYSRPTHEAAAGVSVPTPPPGTRPRVIATTDGEIDDRCSMVRFLLYANQWDIEGIIHSSSCFHFKGNGKDIKPQGWADEVWLDNQIDLYEKIYPKLSGHAEGFPTADALRKLVYAGNVVNVGDMSEDTPGSDRIVEILLDDKPGPVYLQAWGGTNTIARALWKIQHEHPDQVKKVAKKAAIYIILDQDGTFRAYIEPNWPGLQVLGSFRQFAAIAYGWAGSIPQPEKSFFEKPWMEKQILKDHSPLCAVYESNRGAFRSEGDSPSFMHQIDVGLRSLEHPGWGGWGGRFVQEQDGGAVWRGARDAGNLAKPIWRWAEAFQNDWAARADWCVKDFDDANHPPLAKVAGPLDRTVKPGQKVTLSAEGSTDPDGDRLKYRWWQYTDVDSAKAKIDIADSTSETRAGFVVPDEPGKTLHIILEVTDDGSPPLTRYQRIVFTIAGDIE